MPSKKKRRGPGRPRKPKPIRNKLTRDVLYRINDLDRLFREQRRDPNPSRRFLSYRGLAKKFDWGKNTVVRDIATMILNYKAPLEFIEERGGWGYTDDVFHLPTILVSEGDLTVLCASWAALERRRDSSWGERVRPVMERLMSALGHDISIDFQSVSERIVFRASGYQDAIDINVFETVVGAVLSQHELRFVYQKTLENGMPAPPEERHVQPRCLICVDNAWYIVADDPLRGGHSRTFALFRMQSAEDTGNLFTPSGEFDLDEILGNSLGIYGGGPVATVEILFQPSIARFVREQFWHKSERFTDEADGRVRLTMEVAMNPELELKIQRWGSKAEVVGPPVLRERFVEYAREMMEMYLCSQKRVNCSSVRKGDEAPF